MFSAISRFLVKFPFSLVIIGDETVLGEPTLACRDDPGVDGVLKLFFGPSTEMTVIRFFDRNAFKNTYFHDYCYSTHLSNYYWDQS